MNQTEINNLVIRLGGLFPSMTDDQGEQLSRSFARHEADHVAKAIEAHFATHTFVNGAELMAEVERNRAAAGFAKTDRLAAVLAEQAETKRQHAADLAVADASWAAVDTQLAGLDDDAIAALKVRALERLPGLAKRLATADARTNKTLRAMMAELHAAEKVNGVEEHDRELAQYGI